MRNYKIVVDSSANLINKDDIISVPLSLSLGDKIYTDDDFINVENFLTDMENYKGKSTSACPSSALWQESFNTADELYCISITSKLSGCYNSLLVAKETYLEENNKDILTFDSLSTGPELLLFVEKTRELIKENKTISEIETELTNYRNKTHLLFMFKSLQNFAKNGRVNVAVAKLVKLLHLCIVGKASEDGNIAPTNKCRGEKKGIDQLFENMISNNYNGGKVRITHTFNLKASEALRDKILNKFPNADITISENKALCAYYTERYGVLVAFEE